MTDTKYVTVPRELAEEWRAAIEWITEDERRKRGFSPTLGSRIDALLDAAAPPAASVRARETMPYWNSVEWLLHQLAKGPPYDPAFAETVTHALEGAPLVRTLLAPAVDERAASSEAAVAPEAEPFCWVSRDHMPDDGMRFIPARRTEGDRYNVPLYLHPTTADAGVTEELLSIRARFVAIELHHVSLNARKGRPEQRSTTLRLAREGIAACDDALARAGGK